MPLNTQFFGLIAEIENLLKANTDERGNPKPVTVKSEKAEATISITEGARVVRVQDFFAAVKEKSVAFWSCIKVEVGKADTLLGKEKVDELSDKKTGYTISISLKK